MRSGAGLVTLGIPKSINISIIKIKPREVMTLPLPETKEGTLSYAGYVKIIKFIEKIDVLVIGPGLSQNKSTQSLVRKLYLKTKKPVVIDADGLNALAGHLKKKCGQLQAAPIFTPHLGEMSRLSGMSIKKIQGDKKGISRKFAADYNATVVLKGQNTLVADYKHNLYINKTGNPGMATAGSGDVLTGMIAALLGQGLDAFAAAKYAVYLHGLAGDLAAKEKTQMGMIASDIIAKIPEALKRCS